MADGIPADLVDKMMVRCARRCCICRRFRPTKLQVHHIKERAEGGTNDEGNLIVVCFSCHSDVHTKVPFARRFSQEELKGHRDALVRMVEQGLLPTADTDDADEVMAAVVRAVRAQPRVADLAPEAVEVLLRAVNGQRQQGTVLITRHSEGMTVQAGGRGETIGHHDQRAQARYKRAVRQLTECGLLDRVSALSDMVFEVTYEGYLAADEIAVARAKASVPEA